ncbi:transposase [Virgibacillus sp. JSM 102003]|uniref:transposase n=1 Tax=Virgibacillus sp. JSM 102003 TaxID=1562108 RepID=UPI0035C09EFB
MGEWKEREFKEHICKLIVEEGRVARELAREMELSDSTVYKWVSDYKAKKKREEAPEQYITPAELEKLKNRHEKELQDLKDQNEILKKAMHIFTKNPE